MYTKLIAFWKSLPHRVQAGIVTFASVAGASLIHGIEDAGFQNCTTWSCVGRIAEHTFSPHMLGTAIFAGAAALKLFYMLPNGTGQAPPPQPPAQAQKAV